MLFNVIFAYMILIVILIVFFQYRICCLIDCNIVIIWCYLMLFDCILEIKAILKGVFNVFVLIIFSLMLNLMLFDVIWCYLMLFDVYWKSRLFWYVLLYVFVLIIFSLMLNLMLFDVNIVIFMCFLVFCIDNL